MKLVYSFFSITTFISFNRLLILLYLLLKKKYYLVKKKNNSRLFLIFKLRNYKNWIKFLLIKKIKKFSCLISKKKTYFMVLANENNYSLSNSMPHISMKKIIFHLIFFMKQRFENYLSNK